MSEKIKAKVKALFPEGVEAIVVKKDDYDRLYGDLTLENIELKQEIERLNNIINELEKELFGMYVDIAGWNEDYAKKRIEKIKDSNKKCELIKNNKKDISIKSDELKCQFSDIWEYGDR